MPTFLSTLSPLALLVLLVFLFGVALVVALWSLLTLGSSPRTLALRTPRVKKVKVVEPQPLSSNRFMRRREQKEEEVFEEEVESELPTDHVSRSRVRILKTLEPDPELEAPAFKPTTYDQLVNRQRIPKTALPKVELRKTSSPAESLNAPLPQPPREIGAPKMSLREANRLAPEPPRPSQQPIQRQPAQSSLQQPLIPAPKPANPTPHKTAEDTSTQPALFEAGKKTRVPPQQTPVEPEPPLQGFRQVPRQPSVQRAESEAAFRASQGQDVKSSGTPATPETPNKSKTQKEKDEAFENFLRKNDDLGF
jgi:hypothetical protein